MSLDTITLADAMRLLSLPRVVGTDPGTGEEITAQNGRYGPYLKRGTDSRSLETEDQMFDVTLDEALAIYALPKTRGRAAAKPPLRELGTDPVSGAPVIIKEGRFGAYVTDGETNATLRTGDSVHERDAGAGRGAADREAGEGSLDQEARGQDTREEDTGQEGDGEADDGKEGVREEGVREEEREGRPHPAVIMQAITLSVVIMQVITIPR